MRFQDSTLPMFLAAALVGSPVLSQGATNEPAESRKTANYAALDTLVGATVRLEPSAEERQEAREEGEKADRPTGEVDEILMDADSGKLEWAVVSFGGFLGLGDKSVAVPFHALRWNTADQTFRLAATENELKALPEYDLDKARESGLDDSITIVETSWTTIRKADPTEASARRGRGGEAQRREGEKMREGEKRPGDQQREPVIAISGKSYVFYPQRLVTAGKLDDYEVYARNEEFGSVSKVLVDCSQNAIDLVVVDRGGVAGLGETSYLLPFHSMKLCQCADDVDELVLYVDRSIDELESSVKYEKPETGLVDPAAAREARGRFERGDRGAFDADKKDKDKNRK